MISQPLSRLFLHRETLSVLTLLSQLILLEISLEGSDHPCTLWGHRASSDKVFV